MADLGYNLSMPKVLILTGPGGGGKTTIAKLIAERRGFEYLDGDKVDSEFFPDGDEWLPENSEKLRQAHEKILERTKDLIEEGKSVVVDYIIFGRYVGFLDMFKKAFGSDVQVQVLFPSQQELIKRDKEREIWTTGAERIEAVSKEFLAIKDIIGTENFLDTTGQTPEETFEEYFANS